MRFLSDITRYSYSPREIKHCFRPKDLWDFKLRRALLDRDAERISKTFYKSNSSIIKLTEHLLRNRSIFCTETPYDTICLRRTDQILRKTLRSTTLNRNSEVRQFLEVLKGQHEATLYKTDIQSFFESVSFEAVIDKLSREGFRNNSVLRHLKALNEYLITHHKGYTGLPRGIALSSTLADYYLQDIDNKLLSLDNVIYHTRYVDDICLLHVGSGSAVHALIADSLKSLGLTLNPNKTRTLPMPSSDSFDFLGYKIGLIKPQKVSISASKLGKIKKRIVLSFRDFLHSADFLLLVKRLRFLSTCTSMKKEGRTARVRSGLSQVYRLCTPDALLADLVSLDRFLQGLLGSNRYYIAKQLKTKVSTSQLAELRSVSFQSGHKAKITMRLDKKSISTLKKAWMYE